MASITDKRLIFILGNDGAGKTTAAAALALLASRQGKRVLVVSTDPGQRLGHTFAWEIGEQGAAVCAGVHALEIDSAKEETLFERICTLIEDAEDYYDLVIFDNAPMASATTDLSSECQALFERCQRRFQNPDNTALLFVMTADSASVKSAASALESLSASALPLQGLLINKTLPENSPISGKLSEHPQYCLPLMPTEIHGIGALQQIAVLLQQSGL
ncbi:Arsenical pump-driving ATPase [Marinomonas aquimarina]|uniref:arsenite-transporting ATPase n=1 Tax=Marinomonas aquimarina TaxID=295068 RepID=A0A1A8TDI1_9GAMM|nr:ArsA-related P-loop ATPase [Marinomonas aquimarina]SBS30397.1 Arsenical pump-driving ATPase [Marinomonas aquimarina]